ncbi:MAG: ion transporter [Verrucomicrobiales bacterium]|nr:ion transporter [Verrucomicrobiales bacterium]
MSRLLQRIAESKGFQRTILGVIVAAGILVGAETDPALVARYGGFMKVLDQVILWTFVVELLIKLGAHGRRWWRFFGDPWNVFDFTIVAVCFLPFQTQFAAVLRLARVLRVLRLVSAVPRLQILVDALLRSIPSMGYVALLLALHFYVYAVIGVSMMGTTAPEHFGNLWKAMLTLFQVVTLEGWADIMRSQLGEGSGGRLGVVAYFITFILLGTMIILNLLIGVIMNGMQEAQNESENASRDRHIKDGGAPSLLDEINLAERQLNDLRHQLNLVRTRLRHEPQRSSKEGRPNGQTPKS